MNSYNIFDEKHYSTILYHAIANDEDQVKKLAKDAGVNLDGMIIEIEKENVKDELGRSYTAKIEDAQVI